MLLLLLWCVPDAFHAAVQPAGQAASPEVVHGHGGAGQEEDGPRAHAGGAGPQAQDVQLPGVAGPEDRLQTVSLLHRWLGSHSI